MTTTQITATVNVRTGQLAVHVPDAEDTDIAVIDGRTVFTLADLEPWGAEEYGMERADAALTDLGWARTDEWSDDPRSDEFGRICTVESA